MPAVHPTRRLIETSTAILIAIIMLAAVFVIMPQPAQGAFHGNMGSFVSSIGDKDLVPVLENGTGPGVAFCFGYIEDSANPGDPSKNAWMFHLSEAGDCTETSPENQRTWLITAFGGSTSGAQKWLTSGDTQYTGSTFDGLEEIAPAATWLCYGETDGIDGYSIGDTIYINEGFSGSTDLEVNDLRLSAVKSSTLTPFTASVGIVKSTDTDYKRGGESSGSPPTADPSRLPVDRTLSCGDFDAKMLNLGSLDSANTKDVFYLTHADLPTSDTVYPGMLRLTSISGISGHGEKVLSSNNDVKRTLEIATAMDLVVVDDGDPGAFDSKLAIQQDTHPAGANAENKVRKNDIYIKRNEGASSSSPGTLVTHAPSGTQIGVGTTIDSRTALAAQIYYIDTSPTGVFDDDDPVYIKHPDNGGAGGVEVGDIRLNVPGESDGTSVENSDSDFLEHQSATGVFAFQLKLDSEEDDTRMPLKSVSNGKFINATDTSIWDSATDPVFITSASTLTVGGTHYQLWDPEDTPEPIYHEFDCDTTFPQKAGADHTAWCGDSLKTGKLKTAGERADWIAEGRGQGDRLYWSDDNFLTVGDFRMGDNLAETKGRVEVTDGDVTPGALFQSSDTTLFASVHTGFDHPTSGDIQLYPSFGNRWTHTTTGAIANPQEITSYGIVRAELGEGGSLLEDVYYLDFTGWASSSGTPCDFSPGRALRLLPYESKNAGSFVLSGDTIERQSTRQCESTTPENFFGYIDNSPLGLDPSEFVYLDLPNSIGGGTDGTMAQWNSRITPISQGSSTFAAGTQVKVGDADYQSFSGDSLDGIGDAKILWWDSNENDVVDQSDALWLRMRTGLTADTPTFMDIRLNGSPASSPGGGGSTPTTPDNRPTASFTTSIDGRELSVDGSGSSAISGRSLEEYAWDYGDGNEVVGSQAILTHTYDEEGQYTVRLTVTDSQGESRSSTTTVQTDGYEPPETPTDTPTETETETSNETETGGPEEEPTPGVALVVILAVLGSVVAVLRRRR